ncbi:MAG: hypothetical protein IJW92_03840 [Clostridia bacterium]|nr:hypothetical protein [Clostridia bacterium]
MREFLRKLFFPPQCSACRTLLDWNPPGTSAAQPVALCRDCLIRWEAEKTEACAICGCRVSNCRCMPLALQKAKCTGFCKLVYYSPRKSDPVQNRLIYYIKRNADRQTPRFLADELVPSVYSGLQEIGVNRDEVADFVLVTYLPRGGRSRLQYGTDQAKELARTLSERLGAPMRCLIRRRRGADREQKRLSPERRLENAKHSFLAARDADCNGKVVLLVDDVVTTGASMAACTRILRKLGASYVLGVAVASDEVNRERI